MAALRLPPSSRLSSSTEDAAHVQPPAGKDRHNHHRCLVACQRPRRHVSRRYAPVVSLLPYVSAIGVVLG